ncbi:MAG TPA: aquaporin Z [Polyangia bacterium]|jgi:aquaporin Z|nr:aquaporin Z [Polyangia bacterium]
MQPEPKEATPTLSRRLAAEFTGTFVLVLGGCGSAVLAAAFPNVGIGLLGVSLAFGLTVLGCAYALGPISGCHLNPAVTLGLCVGRRFLWRDLPGYVVAQLLGSVVAAGVLLLIARDQPSGYEASIGGLASNGYGLHSPGHYGLGAALLTEVVLTFIFVSVILGSTARRAVAGFAGIPIGLTLTLVHLVGIPVTNVSVNPARSTGPALWTGGWALAQLWLFWVAPLIGAVCAGWIGAWLHEDRAVRAAIAPRGVPTLPTVPATQSP